MGAREGSAVTRPGMRYRRTRALAVSVLEARSPDMRVPDFCDILARRSSMILVTAQPVRGRGAHGGTQRVIRRRPVGSGDVRIRESLYRATGTCEKNAERTRDVRAWSSMSYVGNFPTQVEAFAPSIPLLAGRASDADL